MATDARRSAPRAAILAVVLSLDCASTTSGFRSSGSATVPPPPPNARASSVASSGLDPWGPVAPSRRAGAEDGAFDTDPRHRIISHDELMALRGLTVEQAWQRLRELGFRGNGKVTDARREGCPDDKVCYTIPSDWLAVHGDIELCRHAKLTIAPPPP